MASSRLQHILISSVKKLEDKDRTVLLQLGFKVLRSPIYKTLCDPSLPGERGARQLSNFRQSSKAEIGPKEEGSH